MASKISSHSFYVAITPYNVQGVEDQFNELCVSAGYTQHTHQFYVSLHAGWKSTFGHGSIIMGDNNPLTAATWVYVKESPKNSQKTIDFMGGALEQAKADIAWLFDERMWPQLQQFVKDVALYGYNAMIENRIKGYKNERTVTAQVNAGINNPSTNQKIMAENAKAADHIGKTIVVGDNQATIVIKSVQDNGMLACEFKKTGDTSTTPLTVTLPNLQAMQERGLWRVTDGTDAPAAPATAEVKTEADVEEVDDVVPVVTKKPEAKPEPKPEPKPAEVVDIKPAAKPKEEKPKAKSEEPKAEPKPKATKAKPEVVSGGTLTYETYTSSKGKTCVRILGFKADDAAYKNAAEIHGSASWNTTKEGRVLYVAFGSRYVEKAKEVCDALNGGKSLADCKSIIDEPKANAAGAKTEKTYTASAVAEMLRKVLAGGDVPEDIKKLLAKAA